MLAALSLLTMPIAGIGTDARVDVVKQHIDDYLKLRKTWWHQSLALRNAQVRSMLRN